MARQFVISDPNNAWVFTDEYGSYPGYISYRHVIQHAFFSLIQTGYPLDTIKEDFITLKKRFDQGNDIVDTQIPIKIYFFRTNNQAALVDDTKWCFPLICYLKTRGDGLAWAMNNIEEEITPIIKILSENKEGKWTKELQDEMNKLDSRNKFSNGSKAA